MFVSFLMNQRNKKFRCNSQKKTVQNMNLYVKKRIGFSLLEGASSFTQTHTPIHTKQIVQIGKILCKTMTYFLTRLQ